MEIKINKEIRSYKETVCFGLTVRQLICSLLAVVPSRVMRKIVCRLRLSEVSRQ